MLKHIPDEVLKADRIYLSHSGGKDSQAMACYLKRLGLWEKVTVVHSHLGEMEWEDMKPWIEETTGSKCHVVESEIDFFELARKYGRLPSGMTQFCTDFLKIKPIGQFIHDDMKKNGYKTAINATGMRAEESKRRREKPPFSISKGKGTSGLYMPRKYPEHLIYDWLPIFGYLESDVYEEIKQSGQVPHWVYTKYGFSRLSCVMCVNGRISEHQKASELRPALAQKMMKLERDLGKTLRVKQIKGVKYPKYLDEYIKV